ncbi:amidohydrolase [Arthrobacter sp. MI7-26]|uniref:amidohydrolase n=1 Tax=Arthrobacter sp. MI7-26 TaxID=2993653 RepID=UPI0022487858|nr:amidohydrolase [Arthrobacter sp. MI7-26]MCX2746863.1 amidohydrolase [Arthrobacter sp. MI7-26]
MAPETPGRAPVLYANTRFRTLDPSYPTAEALLVEEGRIVALGDYPSLSAHAPAGTRTADLDGLTVLPGLTDSHIHTASLGRALDEVDLRGTLTADEALARVAGFSAGLEPGRWVFGGWWDFNKWKVPVQPDLRGLDAVCPNNPVALTSADGHTMWANSLALAAVGIEATTPDPAGGEIVRFSDGRPRGILREAALFPLRELANSPLSGDLPGQLQAVQERLLSVGITSIHDIDGADCLEGYRRLRTEGHLALRVHKLLSIAELDAAIEAGTRTGDGDEWIRTGAVKIFSDGAIGSHTCHMSEPFPGEDGNYGIAVTEYAELIDLAGRAAAAGIAVASHAIGDQANHNVLRAYQEIKEVSQRHNLRHRIEHAQFLQPQDIAMMARLGAVASMQPTHCTSDLPLMRLIEGRNLAAYAWRSMLDAGVPLAFGSDAPVEEPDPFAGIHAAITRQGSSGEPAGGWMPSERISAAEAVRAYTTGAAYASGEEHVKGRLSPGMLADFIAVDVDPFTAPADEILETTVHSAVVDGVFRYRR